MSRQTYDHLKSIATTYPFLKDKIVENIFNAYSVDEICNNLENILDTYDYEDDLFQLTKPYNFGRYDSHYSWSESEEFNQMKFKTPKIMVLFNFLFSRDHEVYHKLRTENQYKVLFKSFNMMLKDLDIKTFIENSKNISTPNTTTMSNRVGFIAEFIYYTLNSYLYIKTSNNEYQFFKDIENNFEDMSDLLEIYGYLNSCNELYKNINRYDGNARFGTLSSTFDKIFATIYEKWDADQIAKIVEDCHLIEDIMTVHHAKYIRTMSALNTHIADEQKQEMLKKYTSAPSLKDLAKELIRSFDNYGFDSDKLTNVINSVVINNKKIRDPQFPSTKDRVIHELFKNVFCSNNSDGMRSRIRDDDDEMGKLIDEFNKYFYDPYFITELVLQESVISGRYNESSRKRSALVERLLGYSKGKYLTQFFDSYFDELAKDEKDRKSTVKSFYEDDVTFGALQYIYVTYVIDNLSNDKTNYNFNIDDYLKHRNYGLNEVLFFGSVNKDAVSYIRRILNFPDNDYNRNDTVLISVLKDIIKHSVSRTSSKYYRLRRSLVSCNKYIGCHRLMNYLDNYKLDNKDFAKLDGKSISIFSDEETYYSDYIPNSCKYYNTSNYDYTCVDILRSAYSIYCALLYSYIVMNFNIPESIKNDLKSRLIVNKNVTVYEDNCYGNQCIHYTSSDSSEKIVTGTETDHDTLNYIGLDGILCYLELYRVNSLYDLGITLTLVDDLVFIPESIDNLYNAQRDVVERTKMKYDKLNTLSDDEFNVFKPAFIDNFDNDFSMDRTLKAIGFGLGTMFHKEIHRSSYNKPHSYFYNEQCVCGGGEENIFVSLRKFYDKFYTKYQHLIDPETANHVMDLINQSDIDLQCLVTL